MYFTYRYTKIDHGVIGPLLADRSHSSNNPMKYACIPSLRKQYYIISRLNVGRDRYLEMETENRNRNLETARQNQG